MYCLSSSPDISIPPELVFIIASVRIIKEIMDGKGMVILARGAEAIIEHSGDRIIKKRPSKSYRHELIDKRLRKSRTRREAKVLTKLAAADIPAPILLDMDDKDMRIEMSYLDGRRLRDRLDEHPRSYAEQVGMLVASMHENHIIHGDLTTSNMLVVQEKIHLIDFGLSFFSHKVEDMAVDLNVLHRTIEATHNKLLGIVWRHIIWSYRRHFEGADEVLARLDKVQSRGRNKNK